jgi:ABC-type branched-subunit amino acid transport system substrate-binding protein
VSFEETGVTDTEIRVGSITATTNPLGGPYGDLNQGIELYFDKINGEGGVWGRELTLASERDDAMGNNLQEAEALIARDNVYAAFVATVLFTGAPVLAEAGIPTFGWNINPEWAGPESFFPNGGAICFGCVGRGVPWLASEAGATSAAIVAYGVSDQSKLCAEGNRRSFEEYGPDLGIEVGFYDDSLTFGQTDMSAQVSAMRDADVDFVATCMDLNGVFTLASEMQRQGLDATFTHPNMYDRAFVAENGELFEGDYVAPQFVALEHEPQIPAVQDFIDAAGDDWTEITVQGWIAAKQFVDALKATGPEFTREALIEAWNNQPEPYTADGWIAPLDWKIQHVDPAENPENAAPLTCTNYVQIRDGEFVPAFAEGDMPWVCFEQDDPDNLEPQLMSFAE